MLSSKKLWVFIIGTLIITGLRAFDKLTDLYFTILFGGQILIYLFIQGQIDIAKVRINTPQVGLNDKELEQ